MQSCLHFVKQLQVEKLLSCYAQDIDSLMGKTKMSSIEDDHWFPQILESTPKGCIITYLEPLETSSGFVSW